MTSAHRAGFEAGLGFQPDPFQRDAFDAIDGGSSVLVAAPTGAGKTLVAEYAVATALANGGKAFYTAPIKALSNQKYRDLGRIHRAEQVGLLTGDTVRNSEAPVVVMTTEVLRNMLYAGSDLLDGLSWVVLDEIHFLQDPYRGPVWEEIVIHLPAHVGLVALSATVTNVDELAGWIRTVRGATDVVTTTHRPVPLRVLMGAGDRVAHRARIVPLLDGRRAHPDALRLEATAGEGSVRGGGPSRGGRRTPRLRIAPPRRLEMVAELAGADLLPAIYFIFSRIGCDEAADLVADAGMRFTDEEQRARIAQILDERLADLDDDDLAALGLPRFRKALEAGVAAHHAGMIPPFKEIVEVCFTAGLLSVVFATETLALGINMPARTVVIERLTKLGGEARRQLTPSEVTQLTGRAGRRGLDEEGDAVLCWSPWTRAEHLARLASSQRFPLTSAFRPTYNMSVNLIRRHTPHEAAEVLNRSFAQYQSDQSVVATETRLVHARARREDAAANARCDRGDVATYAAARRTASAAASAEGRSALASLRPGAVIDLPGSSGGRPVVVIAVSERRNGTVRVTCVGRNGRRRQLHDDDFAGPPTLRGQVDLPTPYRPTSTQFQRAVAKALRGLPPRDHGDTSERNRLGGPGDEPAGVEACPELDRHLRALAEVRRLDKEISRLESQVGHSTSALANEFERRLDILEAWGMVSGWHLSAAGERLSRIYHECDLLVAEALRSGLFHGLDAPTLAGLTSVFTHESRGPGDPPPPWFPTVDARDRVDQIGHLAHQLRLTEATAELEPTREIDASLFGAVHGWASGVDLPSLLHDEELAGGDFVRALRLVIDLLGQIADVSSDAATAATAREAISRLDRGVVELAARA